MGRSPPARAQSGSRPQRELHVVGSECASRRHGRGARPGGAGRAPLARGPAPPHAKWLTTKMAHCSGNPKNGGSMAVYRLGWFGTVPRECESDAIPSGSTQSLSKAAPFLFAEQHWSVARRLSTLPGAPPPRAPSAQREPQCGASKAPPLASPARCPPSGNGRSRESKDLTAKGGRKPRRGANRARA